MIDLKLDQVSKKYKIRRNEDAPKRWYRRGLTRSMAEVWALRDVSFEVNEGEVLGIVGHNGAGKTTILKLLSNITAPTRGEITIRGRLAALIEVSSGFHPELTGRENVFLHGSMLGMRRSEIARNMDSIVEFSGVEKYIDVPVKRYSSGMYVRLGFSIAAHLEPDIVLLDEVLAVGDVAFQAKCLDRIAELRRSGRTIVFVSHDLAAVYRICDRAILIEGGRLISDGEPRSVISQYQKLAFDAAGSTSFLEEENLGRSARCVSISFHSNDAGDAVRTGYPMTVRLGYRAAQRITDVVFRVSFYWPSGYICAQLTNESSGQALAVEPGSGVIEFQCPLLPMVPGLYRVDVAIETEGCELDSRQRCATLFVQAGKPVMGDFYIENAWTVDTRNSAKSHAAETSDLPNANQ
jgi:ABC-type polysaccharide/polyol phosphate transport system ATPase subunit